MIKKILFGLTIIGIISFGAGVLNARTIDCPDGMVLANNNVCVIRDDTDIATDTIPAVMNILMWGIGIVSVGVIVLGAIMMISSAGSAERAKKGRLTVIGGVVGLVIAMLAYAIVSFVYTNINTQGG